MAMPVSVCMGFKRTFLHLIYLTYLISFISLFAQQQGSPCRSGSVCGLNGIGRVSGNSSNCSCPPGLQFVVNDNSSKGCRQDTFPHQSCSASAAIMHTIEQIDWFGNDYMDLNVTNATACKQACLEDCFCTVDENYHAKIADFGKSKLIGAEQTRTFTMARGTIGYIAPEWQKNKAVTVKVDVYSFGVVLLEIICCRKMFELHVPENEMVLCDWVYDCFKYGQLLKLVEEQDCGGIEATQLERMVLVGLWCIQEDSSLRPSMKKVLKMLEGTVEIQVPPLPEVSSS